MHTRITIITVFSQPQPSANSIRHHIPLIPDIGVVVSSVSKTDRENNFIVYLIRLTMNHRIVVQQLMSGIKIHIFRILECVFKILRIGILFITTCQISQRTDMLRSSFGHASVVGTRLTPGKNTNGFFQICKNLLVESGAIRILDSIARLFRLVDFQRSLSPVPHNLKQIPGSQRFGFSHKLCQRTGFYSIRVVCLQNDTLRTIDSGIYIIQRIEIRTPHRINRTVI